MPYSMQVHMSSSPKAGAWWTRPVPSVVVTYSAAMMDQALGPGVPPSARRSGVSK